MNSGGHRGFTVVTIVTLIFAPIFLHHAWMWRLVGETRTTQVEQCAPAQPCPAHKLVVNTVRESIPTTTTGGQGGNGAGDLDGGNNGSGNQGSDNRNHGKQGER